MGEIKVTVKGTVAGIVFRNDETGYTVLVLELIDGGKATCVGTFANLSVGSDMITYVTQLINNIYDIINRSGVQMLIFLAGLQSISPAIYESCEIDGATAWETFWKITVPMISPMILVNAVYTVIDAFTASSNEVMTYINSVYSQAGGNVLSAAMSWMYFLLVIACIGIVVAVLSAFVFYQRRD